MLQESILRSVTFRQKLLHDGVSAFAEQLNIPSLLVLDDHGHALARAIELKHVEYLVLQCVALAIPDD